MHYSQTIQEEKTVIFDLDDSVGIFCIPCAKILNEHTGLNIDSNDWGHDTDLCKLYNISNEEFFKLLNDSDIIKIMDPKPDASFVTNELHQRGYQIVFVTARGWHSDMVKITTEWLQKHDIYYDQVEFVHVGESKLGKIKGYKNVKLIIEDNVKHILELRDNGYHTVAVDGSWNKSVPEPRIESLSEILEILE